MQKSFYHPLFLIFLSFVFGIFAADYFTFSLAWGSASFFNILILALLILLILWLMNILSRSYNYKSSFGLVCTLCFFCLGFGRVCLQNKLNSETHYAAILQKNPNTEFIYQLSLREKPIEKQKSWKAEVEILSVGVHKNTKTIWQNTEGKAILYFQKDSIWENLVYGQSLFVKAKFKKISNGEQVNFDYTRFLFRKQIYFQAYIKSEDIILGEENKGNILIKKSLHFQSQLLENLSKTGLNGRELSLASALLLGQIDNMDEDLQQAYRSAGLIHILCVSGLHIGLFATVLLSILSFLKNKAWQLILKLCLVCFCIWIYAFVVGLSPSVMRAAIMFSFVSLGQCLNRESDVYRSLLSSALLLLVINPYTLFSIGFQLSYLAVIGIVAFQKLFLKLWTPKYKIIVYFWELIGVSLSAQIATAPLVIYYFHQFPNYFIISNLFGAPLSALLLPLGMALLCFTYICIPIANCIAYLFTWALRILNIGVLYIEKLPLALWENIRLSLWGSLILYALILCIWGAIAKAKKQYVYASLCSFCLFIIVA